MTPPIKPRWDQVFIQRHVWRPEDNEFTLPFGGYLLAVGITYADDSSDEFYNPDRLSDYRGTFHLSHDEFPPIAVINWAYQFNQCGVAFDPPRVDLNATVPHVVTRVLPTRTLVTLAITTVHLGFTWGSGLDDLT
jgi:hypothetical protein